MSEAPAKRRRWFQFRLRTLLIFVGVGAVLCWGFWVGWPLWKNRNYRQFVESVQHLKAGMTKYEASQLIHGVENCITLTNIGWASNDAKFPYQPVFVESYIWDDMIYCVCFTVEEDRYRSFSVNSPCLGIEVFRLVPGPLNYRRTPVPNRKMGGPMFKRNAEGEKYGDYQTDFAIFISGDRKNNPGFKYELIYSDPPQ